MSNEQSVDKDRRNAMVATSVVGGIGALCTAWPFVNTFAPSEKAKAAGAPVEVDIAGIAPGEMKTVEWRGKPVWILRRTPDMIASLKQTDGKVADADSKRNQDELTPDYARNEQRSRKPEYLVAVGICTHLGCSPSKVDHGAPAAGALGADWPGGFFCPCHGSTFDLAGRVFRNKPAPINLEVPPHRYASDTRLIIGEDTIG